MPVDESTTSERLGRSYRLSLKDILKTCSTAFVPLMIGVMTLAITIQQHKQGIENRANDLQIAKDLRAQQLQLDDGRREQDRSLDNQTRQQDRELHEDHRRQDLQIAQAIRQDLILSTYLNEMSQLLILFNFILNEKVRASIVRPKTLIVFQQLDAKRKSLLIDFLYQSNFIRGQHANFELSRIDMNGADLNNIDMTNKHFGHQILTYLSLSGSQLINATFYNCIMNVSNFERALMKGVSFHGAHLSGTNFYHTTLINTDFTNAIVDRADFTFADLTGSNITDEQLFTTETYHRAILPNGTMTLYENFIQNGNCTLQHWNIAIKNTIQIVNVDNKCIFQANVSKGDVTMSQKITNEKLQLSIRRNFHYVEVRVDIKKISSSNSSIYVQLTKLFYNKNEFVIGQDETNYDLTKLAIGEVQTISWVQDNYTRLKNTYSIELYIIFHYSLTCHNIGLFLERKKIFDESD